ncbi:MAG: hypothetical protein [Arizlama microvirus]|nr:MAG: hypothetical protein [Arizlama microvirus]
MSFRGRRHKINQRSARKMFSRTGSRHHVKNMVAPMRGGWRI